MEKKLSAAKRMGTNPLGFLLSSVPRKVIVLIDGLAIGPFSTPEQALTWAYENSRDGIYSLKELINPFMEI